MWLPSGENDSDSISFSGKDHDSSFVTCTGCCPLAVANAASRNMAVQKRVKSALIRRMLPKYATAKPFKCDSFSVARTEKRNSKMQIMRARSQTKKGDISIRH